MTHSVTHWVILLEMGNGTNLGNAEWVTVDWLACLISHCLLSSCRVYHLT